MRTTNARRRKATRRLWRAHAKAARHTEAAEQPPAGSHATTHGPRAAD